MFKTYVCYIATKLVLIRHMLWGIYTKNGSKTVCEIKLALCLAMQNASILQCLLKTKRILHFRVVYNGSKSSENGLPARPRGYKT